MLWDGEDMPAVTGKTKVVGIIGYPIEHSLSPIMQNAAFAAALLDYIYLPFAVTPEKLEAAVNGLRGLGFSGFNVTIPHKTSIMPLLDRLDESAEAAGAVNTVKVIGSSLIGYNTDGDGLIVALLSELDYIPGSEQILVIGAGGAARGGIAALCRAGAGKILICNRTLDNAYSIKSAMNSRYPETEIDVACLDQLTEKQLKASSLLLNTTSLGMKGEEIEHIDISSLPASAKLYDMVYSKSATPLVERALESFIPAVNGIGMLVAQGELAFKIWTGQNAPDGVMRGALDHICRS